MLSALRHISLRFGGKPRCGVFRSGIGVGFLSSTTSAESRTVLSGSEPSIKRPPSEIRQYCHDEMPTVIRETLGMGELKAMRKERKFIPGVIVDSDEKRERTLFVTAPSSKFEQDFNSGRIFLPPPPWNEPYFYGPLFDVSVTRHGEEIERERCWLVRYFRDPIRETPRSFTLVRRPISEPCRFALQVVVLNKESAPGLRRGYINHLVRVIPAILEPYAKPPDAVFVDVDGLKEKEYVLSDDIICVEPGVQLLIKPGKPILRASRIREGKF